MPQNWPDNVVDGFQGTTALYALQEYELELGASKAGAEADEAEPMAAE